MTFLSLDLCLHVVLGHILGASGLFPNPSNTVALYAAEDADTLFISHQDMKADPEAHAVILSVALADTSSELAVSRRKAVQLRQHYPIPAFENDTSGSLKVASNASGTFGAGKIEMGEIFSHGEYKSTGCDRKTRGLACVPLGTCQNGIDTEESHDDKESPSGVQSGFFDAKWIQRIFQSRSERINRGARSNLFANMVFWCSCMHASTKRAYTSLLCMYSWQRIINVHVCVLSDHFFPSLQTKHPKATDDNGDKVNEAATRQQEILEALEVAQTHPTPVLKAVCRDSKNRKWEADDKWKIGALFVSAAIEFVCPRCSSMRRI